MDNKKRDLVNYLFFMSDMDGGGSQQFPDMLINVLLHTGERGEEIASVLREELCMPDKVWNMMVEVGGLLGRRRPMRAVKRLKDKGLYASDIKTLRLMMWQRCDQLCVPLAHCLELTASPLVSSDWNAEIGDDLWAAAIESVAYLKHRAVYQSGNMGWGSWLEEDIQDIWAFTWLLALLRNVLVRQFLLRDTLQTHLDVIGEMKDMTAMQDELDRTRSELDACKVSMKSAQVDYQKSLGQRDKTIARLEHEAADLRRELEKARAMASGGPQEGRGCVSDVDEDIYPSEPEGASTGLVEALTDDLSELPELPETRITVIGGHPRLVSRLKQMHPGWKFLETKALYTAVWDYGPMECVFCFPNYVSHKLFWTARNALSGTPLFYINSSNIDRVEREFREHYAGVVALKSERKDADSHE